MLKNKKLLIIIPAYQEEQNILKTIKKLKKVADILVVDDGSTDKTFENAKKSGAKIIRNFSNKGYGFSIKKGLLFGLNKKYEYFITTDADGQHKLNSIIKMTKKISKYDDIICGKRDLYNRFSEKIFCKIFKIIWKISDPLCGLKAYKKKILIKINLKKGFDIIGTDILISALDRKAKIAEMNVQIVKRKNESTFGTGFYGEFKILKALIILISLKLLKIFK